VYRIQLKEEPSGWTVNFQYGRRGSSLTTGTKTTKPVPYVNAKKIYTKVVNEKADKGYRPKSNPNTQSKVIDFTDSRDTEIRPQLLNEIDGDDLEKYLSDPDWCAQEKYDGRRRMLLKDADNIVGANRKGLTVDISDKIKFDMLLLDDSFLFCELDGEILSDDCVMLFDLLCLNLTYKERYEELVGMFTDYKFDALKLVETAWTEQEKRAMLKRLIDDNAEGIVFKNIHSLYKPGRPNSGGDQLKFKFCATASCIVVKTNATKRSISLAVYDDIGLYVQVGNCTVYPNQDIPTAGSIVEVKYLYYFPGGSLFQPVLLGTGDCTRDDIDTVDCKLSKLKAKKAEEEA
jgi:bifunctional non-homologous end joining protein LigD